MVCMRRLGGPAVTCVPAVLVSMLLAGCAGVRTPMARADKLTAGIFLDEEGARESIGPARTVSEKGLALTKVSEGFVGTLYEDAASYCTIGYGHLVKKARCDGSEPEEFLHGVTEPRGTEILGDDMGRAERVVTNAVSVELTDGQYGALCDLAYNIGGANFRSSTLLRLVNVGEVDGIAAQFMRWVKAGGKELPGLRLRRAREVDLYYEGMGTREPMQELPAIDIREGE